jgi:DNA repair exonuclease SbcCD ATPase subunit
MRSLKVKIARAERFGRMSLKSIELADKNFTVVLGPNESGKSTLAELIAWVLAGRRQDLDKKFLTSSEIDNSSSAELAARIEGIIDGKLFTTSRKFIVRPKSQGREPSVSAPEISIDAKSVSVEQWQHDIGLRDESDYLRYYRITGPNDAGDKGNKGDLRDVLTALAVGADVTLPPRKVAENLDASARKIVLGPKGRRGKNEVRRFEQAEDNYEEAKSRIKKIEASSKEIDNYRTQILEAEVKIQEIDAELAEARKEHGDLLAAKNLIETRYKRDAVVFELREFQDLTDLDSRIYEQRADIYVLIDGIKSKNLQIAGLHNELENKKISFGLSDQDLSRVTLDEQTVEKVRLLHEDKVQLIHQIEQLEAKRSEIEANRKALTDRLERYATQFEVSADQMLVFGQLSLDDISFGDPIRDWDQAEKNALSAIETTAISSIGNVSGNRSKTYVSLVILGAFVAAGSQFLSSNLSSSVSVIGLAISVVAGYLAMSVKRSLSEESSSTPHVERRNSGIEERKRKALQVIKDHGFAVPFTIEKAMNLRGARTDIQNLVASINSNAIQSSTNESDIARLIGKVDSKNTELKELATRIGLVGYGSDLLPSFVRELHVFMLKRQDHDREQGDVEKMKSRLDALTEMKYTGLSIAQIKLMVESLCIDIEKRNNLESDRRNFQTIIDLGAPNGGRIADLLLDSELSESAIAGRLEDLDSIIKTKIEKQQAVSKAVFLMETELEALEADSDLPTFTYASKQSEMEMEKWATEGAAVLLAKAIVESVANDVEAKNQPGLVKRSSEIASKITDGYWAAIKSDEVGVRVLQEGQWITEDALSAGAHDVLRFSIRLAAAEAHSAKHGIALPLILDDPTSSVDAERSQRMLKVLSEFASNHQVILLTHELEVSRIAVSFGAFQVSLS